MLYTFNGINPDTGEYLVPPLGATDIAQAARGVSLAPAQLSELKGLTSAGAAHFGVKAGIDVLKLDSAGWGIIMPADMPRKDAILEALQPLINRRKQQAGARFRDFSAGKLAWQPGENKLDFLGNRDAGPGDVDPDVIPYYLLIVAGPDVIPYDFQYQLDVQYAVGRLHFDGTDDVKMYDQYARSVVAAETGAGLSRRAAFFGAANPDDGATQMSSELLVRPLAEKFRQARTDWKVDSYIAEDATRARLDSLLGGEGSPSLLFTAVHGLGIPKGDSRQFALNGAQLCQDWPGTGPATENTYVAADHLSSDANLLGSIAMFFACFGAGTPDIADFPDRQTRVRGPISDRSFIASLPQRMLSHPRGGALAAIGHIDRAFSCSFHWDGTSNPQITCFESTLTQLMDGYPAGAALEHFNMRYAELASELSARIDANRKAPRQGDDDQMTGLWLANNDARNFVLLGDPAVRLKFADTPAPRASLEPGVVQDHVAVDVAKAPVDPGIVEIATYVTDSGELSFESGHLRVLTRISPDGKLETSIAGGDVKIDDALLKFHSDLVDKALAQRTRP